MAGTFQTNVGQVKCVENFHRKMSPLVAARRMWKESSIQLRVWGCGLDFSSLIPTGWRQGRVVGSCEYGTGASGSIWERIFFFTTRATVILPKVALLHEVATNTSVVLRISSQVNRKCIPNHRYTCPFQQHILIPVSIPLHGLPPNQSREPPSVSTNPSPTPSLSSVKGKVTLLCIPVLPSDG